MLQFGGFAIMPFALLVLTGGGAAATPYAGEIGAALAFLLVGAGLHTTQTAGLALACDLAPPSNAPARRGAALCHAARRHADLGARSSRRCSPTSATCG